MAPETTYRELAERVDSLLDRAGRTILGIVGAPGAGKSTLAERLVADRSEEAIVVPMDGFHLSNSELVRLGRRDRKGAHDTFDGASYVALLERVRAQSSDEIVYAPEFRREIEEAVAGAIAILPQHRLIVTEGNYLLLESAPWHRARPLLSEVWYYEIDDAVRRGRLFARHVRFGRSEAQARAWMAHTDDPNARLIASTRVRADLVIRLEERREPSR